ncbi:DUF6300 family protein [Streptomyces sp. NPDC051639]|uniref:DUF6300 family protein n=1 Tax=Streptomyces sp. NPDC051639 TaxID=3155671 RepID=UPI0034453BF3
MSENEEQIVLRIDDLPKCPRCEGDALLLAQFPNSWKNNRGEDVDGLREALLCPACDREPAAAELVALFAVDDQVDPSNADVFGGLVAAWVESVRHREVDLAMLDDQEERWRNGDL